MKKFLHLLLNPEELSKIPAAILLVGIIAFVGLSFCWAI